MHPLETYLRELRDIRATGAAAPETSYYGPLANLLNAFGNQLKPKVRCVSQLANIGAGMPDFGLFAANQFQRAKDSDPLPGAIPERGVIEVKPWSDDSFARTQSAQVTKYWQKFGLVLVTNYRDFVLVGRDAAGKAVRLESLRLAGSEAEFLAELAHPRRMADAHGERLAEFLTRVMLHSVMLTRPEDLAWFLASYAREARSRVEAQAGLPQLAALRGALEEALGMKFEGDKGDHFFRATLVQTLFYGIFSSWVLWSRENPADARFNWHEAGWSLHVPMIASLFGQIATPGRLKPLGIDEVLDWAGMVLNRVDRAEFFGRFEEEHAVQYFYEPFLKAYDPVLRKELGVWYTPPEIVKYQVERVDRVLREELGIADGLADDQVVILDPCCGTGAYLVEVLRRIHTTLVDKGGHALVAQKLKKAACDRVFGFEILPAPFVVSHLQLGLMLRQLGAPLDHDRDERAGVYLTNALTGWEPLKNPKDKLEDMFPELMEERDAANAVKQARPIIVILGNPPYNGYAGLAMDEERDLVDAYRTTRKAPAPQGQGLNDLYVRFFRMAERRIVDKSGKGIICYISNYSWLEGLSHTGMRERYLEAFDKIWIDCLNGDKYKTGKVTPWGDPDPSVFSTESNREGIQVGTAVSLFVRKDDPAKSPTMRCKKVEFRHLWGKDKRNEALQNATGVKKAKYEKLKPSLALSYPFFPAQVDDAYMTWPALPDLFPVSFPGVKTSRDQFLVDIDLDTLKARLKQYFDPSVGHDHMKQVDVGVMTETRRFTAKAIREYLQKRGILENNIVKYAYRPFDGMWVYWEPYGKLLDEKREDLYVCLSPENIFLTSRKKAERQSEGTPFYITHQFPDWHLTRPGCNIYPLLVPERHFLQPDFFGSLQDNGDHLAFNISNDALDYLNELHGALQSRQDRACSSLWYHALSIGSSMTYLTENADGIRQDWPRIPLPAGRKALLASAKLGREVAALLDTEKPVEGVTCGKIRPELKPIGLISRAGKGQLDPNKGDLDLTAGWGHGGQGGVCMPGRGRTDTRKQSDAAAARVFGAQTLDVWLNATAYWANIPQGVWDYTIGGYQVIKKWLSYREKPVLGRGLKPEEAEYVTEMARRIAALIALQPALDANYEAVKADTWNWEVPKYN